MIGMTRDEAIKLLKQYQGYEPMFPDGEKLKHAFDLTDETVDTLLAALRGPTREMVERMRGEWIGDNEEKVETIDGSPTKSATCSNCGNWLVGSDEYSCAGYFCPACGAPMTDEAVDMMLERWKEAVNYEG